MLAKHFLTGGTEGEELVVQDGMPLSPLQRLASGLDTLHDIRPPAILLGSPLHSAANGLSDMSAAPASLHDANSGARTPLLSSSVALRLMLQEPLAAQVKGAQRPDSSNEPSSRNRTPSIPSALAAYNRRVVRLTPDPASLPPNVPVVAIVRCASEAPYPDVEEQICSRCEASSPTRARYCHECGAELYRLTFNRPPPLHSRLETTFL